MALVKKCRSSAEGMWRVIAGVDREVRVVQVSPCRQPYCMTLVPRGHDDAHGVSLRGVALWPVR